MVDEYPGVKFYMYDVEECEDVAQELGVRSMPTFSIFKDGDIQVRVWCGERGEGRADLARLCRTALRARSRRRLGRRLKRACDVLVLQWLTRRKRAVFVWMGLWRALLIMHYENVAMLIGCVRSEVKAKGYVKVCINCAKPMHRNLVTRVGALTHRLPSRCLPCQLSVSQRRSAIRRLRPGRPKAGPLMRL